MKKFTELQKEDSKEQQPTNEEISGDINDNDPDKFKKKELKNLIQKGKNLKDKNKAVPTGDQKNAAKIEIAKTDLQKAQLRKDIDKGKEK